MGNVWLLIKNYYRMFICKLLRKKEAKLVPTLLIVLFGIFFVLIFASLSYGTIMVAKSINSPEIALSSFSITIVLFTLMLIVTESSPVRKNNDEEILLSLPFKKSEIIIAKVGYFLSFDLIVMILLIMPSYFLYNILISDSSWLISIRAIIIVISCSLLACGIAGLIGSLFIKITRGFRHSEIIKSLFSTALMIGFFIAYFIFIYISQDPTKTTGVSNAIPFKWLTMAIRDGNILSFIMIILMGVLFFSLSVLVKTKLLGHSVTFYQTKNYELKFSEKKIAKSLYKKEINKYLSTPIYVTNTILGPLLIIILAIMIAIIGKDYFINILKSVLSVGYENNEVPASMIQSLNKYFDNGIIFIIALLASFIPTTAMSFSLEGKELWILKAHPINYKDIFIAKILVQLTITIIPIFVASILIGLRLGFVTALFILIIPSLASLISGVVGLYINLLYPKLDWENEQEVVKQGMAVIVSMIVCFILVAVPIFIYFMIPFSFLISLIIITICYIIIAFVSSIILFTNGKKKYEKLNN